MLVELPICALELYLSFSQFLQFLHDYRVLSSRAAVGPLALIKLKNIYAYSEIYVYMFVIVMRRSNQT